MENNGKVFRILAVDGGGIRGIYPAHILRRIAEELNIDFAKHFDLIAGTSTGSIIAAALALGIPSEDVCSLYEKKGKEVFSAQFAPGGALRSKYNKLALERELRRVFGERTLADARTRLLIPSTDITNGAVHVFKSAYRTDFVRDRNVRVADAVLASCSAPLYFDPQRVSEYMLSDGGLWANNPALVAFAEATGKLQVAPGSIRMLSIGTGISKSYYPMRSHEGKNWGLLRWRPRKLLRMILNLQSGTAANMMTLLVPPERYLRIDFESDSDLPLDDVSLVDDLKSKADYAFTHRVNEIRGVLKMGA